MLGGTVVIAHAKRTVEFEESRAHGDAPFSVDLSRSLRAFRRVNKGKRGKKEFEQLNRWFEIALNNMGRGLSMFDGQQQLIVCNKRYRDIFSLPEQLTKPGTPFADIVRYHVKRETGREDPEEIAGQAAWIKNHVAELATGKSFSSTRHLRDGRTILVSIQPLPDGGWVDLQEDITERCLAEGKISWLARHDTLTELGNRFYFLEQLNCVLSELRPGEQFALHWIDLDRFKEVNDTLGHPVGDALLKSVAKRLRSVLREGDVVARLGGDEFAIVQRGTSSEEQASHLASRIIRAVTQPHFVLGHTVSVGASIGVVLTTDLMDAEAMAKVADLALYDAKASGRGTYRIFRETEVQTCGPRPSLEADLRGALARGELELYYQPICDSRTLDIVGMEALMRWNHPVLGMMAPNDFIPIAETTGLIVEMGAWAISAACHEAAGWSRRVRVTVNLSPVQFENGDLYALISEALAHSGLPPQRLELEITEELLLRDEFATNEMLHKLRKLGVSIALDNFGTAYASLSYLRSFPFDKIKIDRSFIPTPDNPERENCTAIINAVTGLARQFKMLTVAEGVETVDHLNTAVVSGCDEVQGFYFSEPVPSSEVEELLRGAHACAKDVTAAT